MCNVKFSTDTDSVVSSDVKCNRLKYFCISCYIGVGEGKIRNKNISIENVSEHSIDQLCK